MAWRLPRPLSHDRNERQHRAHRTHRCADPWAHRAARLGLRAVRRHRWPDHSLARLIRLARPAHRARPWPCWRRDPLSEPPLARRYMILTREALPVPAAASSPQHALVGDRASGYPTWWADGAAELPVIGLLTFPSTQRGCRSSPA